MDVPYDFSQFHGAWRSGDPTQYKGGSSAKKLKTSKSYASILLAATSQLGSDPLGTVGAVTRHATHYALHPIEGLSVVASTAYSTLKGPAKTIEEDSRDLTVDQKHDQILTGDDHATLARHTRLLSERENASSWPEYAATSTVLDEVEHADEWKKTDRSDLYDNGCLSQRLDRLQKARGEDDLVEMLRLIRTELTRDLGGMLNPALHQRTHMGTKLLIDRYTQAVGQVLDRIVKACATSDVRLAKVNIVDQLKDIRRSYGRTALLLSGGGTLGMSHIGVVKALHEAEALPRIISGSSSGSIVASVLGVTTGEELLPALEDFCHGDLGVFVGLHEKQGWSGRVEHFGKHGYLFDAGNLRRIMVDLLGKTTFKEAYNRTQRILNITVSNSAQYESQQVLNFATAGDVVIWSAVVASCAVPFGFKPEMLLCKDATTNTFVPWDPKTYHVDGSIEGDLPTKRLSAVLDVNHTIVSQVNPHVVPFLQIGKTKVLTTAADLAKEEAIRSMEVLAELPVFPTNVMTKLGSVLSQQYSGDITLLPVDPVLRIWTILENPTQEFLAESTRRGERATWKVLNMIKTHMDIELLIDRAVIKASEHISFSQSASNLRRLQLKQAAKSKHASGGRERSGRGGSQQRIKITMTPRISETRFLNPQDTRSSFVVPYDDFRNPAVKVAGDPPSPLLKSRASCASFSLESEDEISSSDDPADYAEPGLPVTMSLRSRPLPAEYLVVQSQPSTPTMERRGFLDSPKSASQVSVPISLTMTPVTPRSSSPESTYKNSTRHARTVSTPIRSAQTTDERHGRFSALARRLVRR